MGKGRIEAFSDAVIAIIITIMVLEIKAPHEASFTALQPLFPIIFSYVLSFVYLGTYWNNHHHLFQAVQYVNGQILWANLHLLFWLSLIPFVTAWINETHWGAVPIACYGIVLLLSGIAYWILGRVLIDRHGRDSTLALALGKDIKSKISLGFYALGIILSFVDPNLAFCLYILVAIFWLIPDLRIEKALGAKK